MSLPVHATEYQKFLEGPEAKAFIAEYLDLCKRHKLCVFGDELTVDSLTEDYTKNFEPYQNCWCDECTAWWGEEE